MDEQDYLRQLAVEAHDTVDMFSSHGKAERERRAVAAFLRCLGVDFSPEELATPRSDPPDVMFRDARFEVMIKLDEGRKMHADWKKKAEQRDSAQSLEELVESYHSSSPVPFQDIVSLVVAELGEKASHYGPNTCSQLDALLYINLLGKHLYPLSKAHVPEELDAQRWRSVCFLFAPYGHVLAVTSEAPDFLRQYEGRTRQECQNPEVLFDL
jgi:hypothetical protein